VTSAGFRLGEQYFVVPTMEGLGASAPREGR
jgi:hypothetical protein